MRPYVGRHERPTPSPSAVSSDSAASRPDAERWSDREATRARASELVARPVYAGRHEGVQTENR